MNIKSTRKFPYLFSSTRFYLPDDTKKCFALYSVKFHIAPNFYYGFATTYTTRTLTLIVFSYLSLDVCYKKCSFSQVLVSLVTLQFYSEKVQLNEVESVERVGKNQE